MKKIIFTLLISVISLQYIFAQGLLLANGAGSMPVNDEATFWPISGEKNHVFFYPNPTIGTITIVPNDQADFSIIQVYNIYGRQVFEYKSESTVNQPISINLPDVPNGVYYLRVTGRIYADCVPLVIQR